MTDILETRLNNTIFSATSCSWLFAAAPFIGITALNYEQKRERKKVYGARKDGTPLGRTGGKYSASASVTMLRSSFQRLIEILTPLGLGSYGDAEFPIVATYSEPKASLAGVRPIVITMEKACIVGEKDAYQEGIDELLTEVEVDIMSLSRNNLRLYSVVNGLGV